MSYPDWSERGAPVTADARPEDGTGWDTGAGTDGGTDDEDLYNPIVYERDDTPATVPDPGWSVRPEQARGQAPEPGTTRPEALAGAARPSRPSWTPVLRPPAEPPTRADGALPSPPDPPPLPGFEPVPAPAFPPVPAPSPVLFSVPAPPGETPPEPAAQAPAWPAAQDPSWPPRRPARRRPPRWLLAASAVVVAAAVAGGTLALTGTLTASGPRPPVTLAAARSVLARYSSANNTANSRRDPRLLAAIETGASQLIDTTAYTVEKAERAAPGPAFAPATARFALPDEPASGPHWFAVTVTNRALGGQHQTLGSGYLLFTQAGPGAPWKAADAPFLAGGPGGAPALANGGGGDGGTATAVAPGASGLAVTPARIAAETARSLDGHGPVQDPVRAALTDTRAATSQRPGLPRGSVVTDTHAPAAYPVEGLRTAGGGALLFYTVAATVTYQAPPGETFVPQVPGLAGAGHPAHRAGLRILDQFAAYDPPAGHGAPRIVAAFSGITSGL